MHAAKLDPSLAAANLRLCFQLGGPRREYFVNATQFRSSLDERDTALLAFAEPYTADPPDMEQALVKLREAAAKYPDDAEIAFLVGWTLDFSGRLDEARAAYDHALELDPHFATVLWAKAGSYVFAERDLNKALATFQHCLEVSSMAASCLRTIALVHDVRGECEEVEADARKLITIEPEGPNAHWWMARALAARGAPPESVLGALTRAADLGGPAWAELPSKPLVTAIFDLLTGDLAAAASAAGEMNKAIAGNTDEGLHSEVTEFEMAVATERGDKKQALALAEQFHNQMPAWTPNDPGGVRLWRLYLLHEAGKLADAPFAEQRETLYAEARAKAPKRVSKVIADDTRLQFYARYVETEGEAQDALTRLTAGGMPIANGIDSYWLGKLYSLAKKVEEAIPLLREAADSCSVMADSAKVIAPVTITHQRANLLLGQALEQSGDKAGACSAYGAVLTLWKHPTPRSITVDSARAAAKKLACPK